MASLRSSYCLFETSTLLLGSQRTIKSGANIQYLCMLVCGEALLQFYAFSTEVESAVSEKFSFIILYLEFFLLMRSPRKSALSPAEWGILIV